MAVNWERHEEYLLSQISRAFQEQSGKLYALLKIKL
jgi:hypothetical protein